MLLSVYYISNFKSTAGNIWYTRIHEVFSIQREESTAAAAYTTRRTGFPTSAGLSFCQALAAKAFSLMFLGSSLQSSTCQPACCSDITQPEEPRLALAFKANRGSCGSDVAAVDLLLAGFRTIQTSEETLSGITSCVFWT